MNRGGERESERETKREGRVNNGRCTNQRCRTSHHGSLRTEVEEKENLGGVRAQPPPITARPRAPPVWGARRRRRDRAREESPPRLGRRRPPSPFLLPRLSPTVPVDPGVAAHPRHRQHPRPHPLPRYHHFPNYHPHCSPHQVPNRRLPALRTASPSPRGWRHNGLEERRKRGAGARRRRPVQATQETAWRAGQGAAPALLLPAHHCRHHRGTSSPQRVVAGPGRRRRRGTERCRPCRFRVL